MSNELYNLYWLCSYVWSIATYTQSKTTVLLDLFWYQHNESASYTILYTPPWQLSNTRFFSSSVLTQVLQGSQHFFCSIYSMKLVAALATKIDGLQLFHKVFLCSSGVHKCALRVLTHLYRPQGVEKSVGLYKAKDVAWDILIAPRMTPGSHCCRRGVITT